MSAGRFKLIVAGVGGQGALTAGRLVGEAAMLAGLPVMVGQLHGMSQRGGPVECSVVIGPATSAHVGTGEADVLLGLELIETRRAARYVGTESLVVTSTARILPQELALRGENYPEMDVLLDPLRKKASEVHPVDARRLAREAGEPRTMNVVMLGALAALGRLPFAADCLWEAIKRRIQPRFVEVNERAFELGKKTIGRRAVD